MTNVLRLALIWTLPLFVVDLIYGIVDKPIGTAIIGGSLLIIVTAAMWIRQILKPKLQWEDLKIEIDYATGEFFRSGFGTTDLRVRINAFGRIIKKKEGIKLFRKGWPSWMSYVSGHTNLNERSWNFYLPSILEDYEEIEVRFKEKKWL